MIHPPSEGRAGYITLSRGIQLPGRYDTEDAARYAFYMQDRILFQLQDKINIQQKRLITLADLQALKRHLR